MANVTLTIDGRKVTADENQTILEAALANGIYIPHLCFHENLHPTGSCRMCVVEQQGVEGVVTSCITKVQEGMVINTKGETAEAIRKLACDFMFKTHPAECTGCPKFGKCQLQSLSQYVGDTGRKLRANTISVKADETNPIILHEMYRCILCGRCVRACQELRAGFPHFLPNYVMGYTEVQPAFSFGDLEDDYCAHAYGKHAADIIPYLEKLSGLVSPDYFNGKGPRLREDLVPRYEEALRLVLAMRPRIEAMRDDHPVTERFLKILLS